MSDDVDNILSAEDAQHDARLGGPWTTRLYRSHEALRAALAAAEERADERARWYAAEQEMRSVAVLRAEAAEAKVVTLAAERDELARTLATITEALRELREAITHDDQYPSVESWHRVRAARVAADAALTQENPDA